MLGLSIRILVLCTVVFAVVYGIMRALRARISERQIALLQAEIRDLTYAVKAGSLRPEEYAARAAKVRRACEDLGVDVPDLPARLPDPAERDG
jgi:hypothetical protein